MDNPLISVIVPVYKVEKYLDRCVESIVNQTYTNLEIILVDDGSPDNCPAMCDAWAQKDKRINVVHQENSGRGAARNAGLSEATGEWIGFVDADDEITADYYEVLLLNADKLSADIVACGFKYVFPDKCILSDEFYNAEKSFSSEEIVKDYFDSCKSIWVSFCNKIIKKELFNGLQFSDLRYFEDWELAPFIYSKCEKTVFLPLYNYNYYIYDGSATRTETLERYYDCVKADFSQYQFFKNNEKIIRNIRVFIKSDFKKCVKTYSGFKDRKLLNSAYDICKKSECSSGLLPYYLFPTVFKLAYKFKNLIKKA